MRLPFSIAATVLLLAPAACSRQPETAATANADAIADQLQNKANNYSMQAEDLTNSDAAVALENVSDTLHEQAANMRAEASPDEGVK